jgi:hypothetical protein
LPGDAATGHLRGAAGRNSVPASTGMRRRDGIED